MSFAAPLFLLAAVAGLIPLVLHMINRQKAPVLPFATLRFLRLSVERTRRRKYIHDVLLLLLRMAALMLIAVALARPALHSLGGLLGGQATSAIAIVLDNSASMGTVDQNRPRFEAAVGVAERLLDRLREADSVALLVPCGTPSAASEQLHSNHEVVRQALALAAVSYERADLAMALERAQAAVNQSDAPNKEVYVITDRQAISWGGLKVERPADGLGTGHHSPTLRVGQLDSESQATTGPAVVLIDVSTASAPNAAVRSVEVQSTLPAVGVPAAATAELFGAAPIAQQRHVELLVNGEKLATSPTLSIEPGASVKHKFQFSVPREGLQRGEVRLVGDDANPLDDRAHFVLNVAPQLPVAIVKPRKHEIAYLEDSYYLEQALSPGGDAPWSIKLTSLTPQSVSTEPLSGFAIVFCVNLPPLESAAAGRMADYVERGGKVVWVCGENVDPTRYNAVDEQCDHRLLPAPLAAVRRIGLEHPESWHLAALDETHPVLAGLTEPASLYQSVLVHRHVTISSAQGCRVLARLDDGEPLLVERAVGRGSVWLWGTSMHAEWTNVAVRPLFLPLTLRMAFYLAGAHSAQSQAVAGKPWVVPLGGDAAEAELTPPSGEIVRSPVPAGADVFRVTDTHQVGIYQLRVLDQARPRQMALAVNADPLECDPTQLGPDDLQERIGAGRLAICNPHQLDDTIHRLREGESLRDLFLIAVLGLLIAESFVANRVGGMSNPSATTSAAGIRPTDERAVRHIRCAFPLTAQRHGRGSSALHRPARARFPATGR